MKALRFISENNLSRQHIPASLLILRGRLFPNRWLLNKKALLTVALFLAGVRFLNLSSGDPEEKKGLRRFESRKLLR